MATEFDRDNFLCRECGGSKYTVFERKTLGNWETVQKTCETCNGSGLSSEDLLVEILKSNLRIEKLLTSKN